MNMSDLLLGVYEVKQAKLGIRSQEYVSFGVD